MWSDVYYASTYIIQCIYIYIYLFIYYVVVRPSACTLCAHFLYWCTVIEQFVGVKKIRVTYLFLLDVCPENTELDSIYPSTVAINSVTTTTTPQPLPRDFINICRHFLTHKDGPCSSPVLPSSSTSLIDLHKYAVIVRRPRLVRCRRYFFKCSKRLHWSVRETSSNTRKLETTANAYRWQKYILCAVTYENIAVRCIILCFPRNI